MKKVKVNLLRFDLYEAGFVCGKKLQAVKLFHNQAMQFTKVGINSFDDLLARYGANNKMREGEYYNGYIVILDKEGQPFLLRMRGVLRKIGIFFPFGCALLHLKKTSVIEAHWNMLWRLMIAILKAYPQILLQRASNKS